MNRRGFLQQLGGLILGALVIPPDVLALMEPRKVIVPGWGPGIGASYYQQMLRMKLAPIRRPGQPAFNIAFGTFFGTKLQHDGALIRCCSIGTFDPPTVHFQTPDGIEMVEICDDEFNRVEIMTVDKYLDCDECE